MFKSPFFQFSAIVLIYKVGLSEMFTSDAEKKTKQNIKLDLNKMFKSPFFQFSAIVLIYKVGLSEMFTSDAKKKNKTKNLNGRRSQRRPLGYSIAGIVNVGL